MHVLSKLKRVGITFLAFLIGLNCVIYITDFTHIYKAVWYNYVDIDDYKIFDNRVIHSSENPQPWLVSTDYNKKELSPSLTRTLDSLKTVAFLVIKDDSIQHESYWDGYDENSISGSFSVAKSYVSALVGSAIKDGYIKNVDQPVADFLDPFKEGNKSKITIKHLLTMSSGLSWDESYAGPFSITTKAYYGRDLEGIIDDLISVSEPGQCFKYLSGDTQVLSFLLEAATKKSVSKYAEEKLWKPMGCENDALWSLDDTEGHEKAYCCINSNARDFARLGKLYLQDGKWNGQTLVPTDYVWKSISPNFYAADTCDFYGYQWWLYPNDLENEVFYARGILGQYIIVIPSKKVVVVRLGHLRGLKSSGPHPDELYEFVKYVHETY